MKKTLLSIILSTFLLACNNSSKNDVDQAVNDNTTEVNNDKNEDGTYKYICTKNVFSDFIVMNTSLDKNSKPHLVEYAFKGIINNNTKDIYKSASIRCSLYFILENGNELTCKDVNYTKDVLGGSGTVFTVKSNWKPNENWLINKVESCRFSTEYFDYPVKEVYTQFFIEVENQINNINEEVLISQRDVTDLWKTAKKKHQYNSPDCTDVKVSDFLENKYPF